ncbi:hypothetical protein FHR81_004884 [Actinoalloteichus hoggarensis]|uniref:Uncharacterized protein n=1 Tax=Actinoalloteichus hoggarensis TaxID=1470176 RepID=A0A221W9V0_9PSEU|nr:hypothetical protein [Actinoalloteichus hoggarensis]ASO22107.1 hypothetical protein AHOG_22470 [Actinoalloteichus hoggarensis]MBB5923811.1 hypothetical protein [Actinoalloteichus hoggarensis]
MLIMVPREDDATSIARPISLRHGISLLSALLGLVGFALLAYQLVGVFTCPYAEWETCIGDTPLSDLAPITVGLCGLLLIGGLLGAGRLRAAIVPLALLVAAMAVLSVWWLLPVGEDRPWLSAAAGALGLLGVVIGCAQWAAGSRARRQGADGGASPVRLGTPVVGRIASVQVTEDEIKGAPLVSITAEYADADGSLRRHTKKRAVGVAHLPRTGDQTVVWYDADHPDQVDFAHSSEQGPLDELVDRVLGRQPGFTAAGPYLAREETERNLRPGG